MEIAEAWQYMDFIITFGVRQSCINSFSTISATIRLSGQASFSIANKRFGIGLQFVIPDVMDFFRPDDLM
jgi:hypothetical protein